ncbi:MAG TPA: SPOR domain-containing protein [Steroidobacteraceae bacterium]|nr:SPOR domain-containing protein [Steroidobacteraceae bacterium]
MNNRRLTARDYKRPRRAGSPGLRGFGYGLALGLIIAGAVFVHDRRRAGAPSEPSHPVPGARRAHGSAADDVGPPDDPQSSAANARGAGVAGNTGAATAPAVGGFDFYRMLPRFEVVVPEHEHASRPSPAAPVERPGTYFLQIGSYHDDAVAERIRTKLAKQGITATVQRVAVDTDVWHRVRVGPIRDLALLNRLRQQLEANNLDSLVVRVDD